MRTTNGKRCFCLLVAFSMITGLLIPALSWSKEKPEVIIAQSRDIASLDWMTNTFMETNAVSRCIFNALIEFKKDYTYGGALATSWQILDDLTWRFHLRQGVKFHNGGVFTSSDVKFTLDRVRDEKLKSPWAWLLKELGEVKVVDPYTIELKTTIPQPGFLAKLQYIPIVPKDVVKIYVNPDFGLHPVGTGPYKFVEWVKDERVVLEANENYWGGKPKIKRVIFRPITEGSPRVAALLAEDIDVAVGVPPSEWANVKKAKNTRMYSKVGTLVYCGLDTLNPPMNNLKVRQAMNYAVDTQRIIETILENSAVRMNGPFHEGTLGYDPTIKPYPYDPKKAKQLLAEAGYPNGFETTLSFAPGGAEGSTNHQEIAEAMAYQLAEVGIKAKIDPTESIVLWSRYTNQQLKMYLYTWPERWEPEMYLRSLFHSKARGYYYRSETADRLLDDGGKVFDPEKRKEIYRQFHRFIFDDAPWIFLFKQMVGFGAHKDLDFEAPHDGYVRPWEWSWKK